MCSSFVIGLQRRRNTSIVIFYLYFRTLHTVILSSQSCSKEEFHFVGQDKFSRAFLYSEKVTTPSPFSLTAFAWQFDLVQFQYPARWPLTTPNIVLQIFTKFSHGWNEEVIIQCIAISESFCSYVALYKNLPLVELQLQWDAHSAKWMSNIFRHIFSFW